mmetsp:Transcript_25271/g.49385  ORF Transcript_25271/g.49385 Transcript_25271/m.49385 type:complete len:132 (-) Transcript_25271:341-736(-)
MCWGRGVCWGGDSGSGSVACHHSHRFVDCFFSGLEESYVQESGSAGRVSSSPAFFAPSTSSTSFSCCMTGSVASMICCAGVHCRDGVGPVELQRLIQCTSLDKITNVCLCGVVENAPNTRALKTVDGLLDF